MPQLDGPFLPTTTIFDIADIREAVQKIGSPEFEQLFLLMYQAINNHAIRVNEKSHGFYSIEPYACGKQLFPVAAGDNNRGIARATYFIPSILNPGPTVVAHNIPWNADTFVLISSCQANNPTAVFPNPTSFPIPAVTSGGTGQLGFWLDNTNINIDTSINESAFSAIVVIEYTT